MDFQRHSGGWGSGYSSFANATFDLPNDLTSYDTLEVYHEHACFDRTNRYQKSDGSYGGCHEWDYLAYMFICDRDNDTVCNTESVRWITTYGREGMWLTDISPYLFMLNDGEDRRFKYAGANRGDLTVTFLFSNWGSGTRAVNATYAFSGGQFDGTYNNESRYNRQLNFTVPSYATSVEIVATITGHGFNQDTANCAEFAITNTTTRWGNTKLTSGTPSSTTVKDVKMRSETVLLPINLVLGHLGEQAGVRDKM